MRMISKLFKMFKGGGRSRGRSPVGAGVSRGRSSSSGRSGGIGGMLRRFLR